MTFERRPQSQRSCPVAWYIVAPLPIEIFLTPCVPSVVGG